MDGKGVSTNSDQLAPRSVKEPIDDPDQFAPISDEPTGDLDPFAECHPAEEVLSSEGIVIKERRNENEEILVQRGLSGEDILIIRKKIIKHETVRKRWKNLRRAKGAKW